MKCFLVILFLLPLLAQAQTNRYISSSYNGSNGESNGSINRPYTRWSQVPALSPGDSVFFKRGDVFPLDSRLAVGQSGTPNKRIYLGAYGKGAKPVLSALTRLRGWASYGNGIWYKNLLNEPRLVLLNGSIVGKGRYPKDKYNIYTYTKAPIVTQIRDASLTDNPSYAGDEIVIRAGGQTSLYRTVTDQSSDGTLTLNAPVSGLNQNYGYFFRNDIRFLTRAGDWMYNAGEKRIYMYLGTDTSRNIQVAATVDHVVYTNKSYITFQNLTVEGGTLTGIFQKNAKFNVVDSCEIRYCYGGTAVEGGSTDGNGGITAEGCSDLTYSNNYYHDITSSGANQYITCPRFTYLRNTFENIGMILGTGEAGSTSGMGMYLIGDSVVVQYNRFFNIGFIPIYIRRSSAYVRNNFINGFCYTKDDGGGIYCWTDKKDTGRVVRRFIEGNIIMNGQSDSGAPNNGPNVRANGIYTDLAYNVTIRNNTIINVSGYGLFNLEGSFIDMENNIVYSNGRSGVNFEQYGSGRRTMTGNTFINNIIITPQKGALKLVKNKFTADYSGIGTFANNYYYSGEPNGVDANGTKKSFAQWKDDSGFEKGSVWENGADKEIRVEYNETLQPKTISLGRKRYKNLKSGATATGQITLQPFEGVALLALSR